MAIDLAKASLPEPDGELQSIPMRVDVDSETAAAFTARADLKLARLFVRAANEDQRIIAADYYPRVAEAFQGNGSRSQEFIAKESTSKTQDFIGSESAKKRHTPGVSSITAK